jgi:endo-1,4-beta-xylanase
VTHTPPTTPSLRERFGSRLQLGCAVGNAFDAADRALLTHHFAQVTPENCMKPEPIHPTPERFDFAEADRFVDFAEVHGLQVVGHTLCWHQQSPAWFFDPGADRRSPEQRLAAHIETVVGRYEGRIAAWDVVNEAIADRGDDLRDTPWLNALGERYLATAFEHAAKAAPHAKLYYNDFNLELPEKRARALRVLRRLQDSGVRVDGVGIQGHFMLDQVPFEHLDESIERFAALGLDVMFTELDLDVVPRPDCGATSTYNAPIHPRKTAIGRDATTRYWSDRRNNTLACSRPSFVIARSSA